MDSVQKLCSSGILIQNGQIRSSGPLLQVIQAYQELSIRGQSAVSLSKPDQEEAVPGYVTSVQLENENGDRIDEIKIGQSWKIRVTFVIEAELEHFIIGIGLTSHLGMPLNTTWSIPRTLSAGVYSAVFSQDQLFFTTGSYFLTIGLSSYLRTFQYLENVMDITISDVVHKDAGYLVNTQSGLLINQTEILIIKD
jgi:hypothetical protein